MLQEILIVAYLIISLLLIGLVLMQQGKGADMGSSLGGGGSNTVFGSSGSGNFLTRTTAILATGFFVICLLLGNITASSDKAVDEFETIDVPVTVPVAPDIPMGDVPVNQATPTASDVPSVQSSSVDEEDDADGPGN